MKHFDGISAQMRTLVFGLVVLVLLAGLGGLAGVGVATRTVDRLADRLMPADDTNAAVLQDLTDAETGIRGWVATGDPTFLQPYYAGRRRLPHDRARLRRLTADLPELHRLVAAQDRAVDDWLNEYAAVRLDRPAGAAHVDPALFLLGKKKFDRIRDVNAQIERRVDLLVAQTRHGGEQEIPWILAMLAIVLALGAVALMLGRFVAGQVSRPLVHLQQVVDRLAGGDGAARAEESGPREVRRVASALNNFADENARIRELEHEVVNRVTDLDRAKSDFLSTVSHELRTPLTSIAGYVELFEDDLTLDLGPQQRSMLEVVKRNVQRLRTLIEDLLTLSRAESEPFRTSFDVLDLTHLTSDVAFDLQAMATGRGITIHEVHPPRAMVMRGDASQLSRALLNLVSNAVKFSGDGGDVTIRVKQVRGWAHLEVTDHGIGIPAAEMPRLATRFYRASNAVDAEITGTGLGLRIVQAIVDNHGGRLEMESVEGLGTTARMVLPLIDEEGKNFDLAVVEEAVGQARGRVD
jgi:signal transduction histidine kinase